MTRLTSLFAALALTGGVVAATVSACAGHPGSPGEMPPIAPRPDNDLPTTGPGPALEDPARARALPPDAGISLSDRQPASQLAAVVRDPPSQPPPDPAPASGAPADAGTPDSYTPPLPPIPDAKLPVPIDAPAHPALSLR